MPAQYDATLMPLGFPEAMLFRAFLETDVGEQLSYEELCFQLFDEHDSSEGPIQLYMDALLEQARGSDHPLAVLHEGRRALKDARQSIGMAIGKFEQHLSFGHKVNALAAMGRPRIRIPALTL